MLMKKRDEKGFTLIELMIVIAIIGILAAIAIPQFAAYRTRSYNSASQADIKNAATAQEAYYIDFDGYATAWGQLTGSSGGFYKTDNVNMTVSNVTQNSYRITAFHMAGNKTFTLDGPGGTIH